MGRLNHRSVVAVASAASLAFIGLLSACAPPTGSSLAFDVVAQWSMDESTGPVMADGSGSGFHGSIGGGVLVGGGTYRFPGWSNNVDGGGRLVGRVPAAEGAVSVPDSRGTLEPGAGSFSMSLRLRSALTAAGRLPTAPAASFNVVQKGRADQAGGFWKLELAGAGASAGRLRWVVSDGARSAVATSAVRIDDGQWHSVVAERRGDQAVLTVDGVVASVSARAVGDVAPGSPAVTIGKKPGSTDPRDAFAGWLDELVIRR